MDGLVNLHPRVVSRVLGIGLGRFLVLKLDGESGVVIPWLHAGGLDPDVLDARNFSGHGFQTVERGLLLLRSGFRSPLHRHHMYDRGGLVEGVLARQDSRAEQSQGDGERERGFYELLSVHFSVSWWNVYSTRCAVRKPLHSSHSTMEFAGWAATHLPYSRARVLTRAGGRSQSVCEDAWRPAR